MKNIEQDKLKAIFGQMKMESPSMSFEKNLMQRVHTEHKLMEKKRNQKSLLSAATGTFILISMTAVVFTIFGYSMPSIFKSLDGNVINLLANIKIDHLMISIASIFLLLLMGDTLIRKHLQKKEDK